MRSRREYIITKDEVHGYANHWLNKALKLEYEGTKCTARTLLQIVLIAGARTVSIFAAYRDLAAAPTDQTVRNALGASLPEILELERRLNRSLATKLPQGPFSQVSSHCHRSNPRKLKRDLLAFFTLTRLVSEHKYRAMGKVEHPLGDRS